MTVGSLANGSSSMDAGGRMESMSSGLRSAAYRLRRRLLRSRVSSNSARIHSAAREVVNGWPPMLRERKNSAWSSAVDSGRVRRSRAMQRVSSASSDFSASLPAGARRRAPLVIGPPPRQQLIDARSHGEHLTARVERRARELLWAPVGKASIEECVGIVASRTRKRKVDELDGAFVADEDVAGLEVAVVDGRRHPVRAPSVGVVQRITQPGPHERRHAHGRLAPSARRSMMVFRLWPHTCSITV
jgi:hypothetical protein